MVPQTKPRKRRNSSKVNLLISFVFHGAILLGLFYFAAREGLLGTQLKTIAVQMIKESEPEPPDEPGPEPAPEVPLDELPPEPEPEVNVRTAVAPPAQTPPPAALTAPPAVAPPAAQLPSFAFEGGRAVQVSTDPLQLYKGVVEYALRSRWNRPVDVADNTFVAEVEVGIDRTGRISDPSWKRSSGHARWDESVRAAIAATPSVNRPPPEDFPARVLVRFDVQEVTEEPRP
ncbi:MAG: TonB C-terminal domain-containing protein [Verrucomicrobiae bacterium]|nr:TonB C-terminal domain-containing protein [Verrucomicrobiae bacterium]